MRMKTIVVHVVSNIVTTNEIENNTKNNTDSKKHIKNINLQKKILQNR